jgi:hypothetical protein
MSGQPIGRVPLALPLDHAGADLVTVLAQLADASGQTKNAEPAQCLDRRNRLATLQVAQDGVCLCLLHETLLFPNCDHAGLGALDAFKPLVDDLEEVAHVAAQLVRFGLRLDPFATATEELFLVAH